MTEKQEKILNAALHLFAAQGYSATSTSKVARAAGVSEGLIFRHFQNKEGLLKALLDLGFEKIKPFIESLESEKDPKDVIRKVIEMPFGIGEDEIPFWRLLYSIKWQTDTYDHSISQPMGEILTEAFSILGFANAEAEAEAVLILLDGIATSLILRKPEHIETIKNILIAKYKF
jgi:AcrR family transcriptional regulator